MAMRWRVSASGVWRFWGRVPESWTRTSGSYMPAVCLALCVACGAGMPRGSKGQPLSFEVFSTQDGLSTYVIRDLARVARGEVWIGTHAGINRYFGTRMAPVDAEGDHPRPYVTTIRVDARGSGDVWFGTLDHGLLRFRREDDRLMPVSGTGIRSVTAMDAVGAHLWVLEAGRGLVDVVLPEVRVRRWNRTSGAVPSDSMQAILADGQALWLGWSGGLALFDTTARTHRPVMEGVHVTRIARLGGRVWFGTQSGELYRIDPGSLAPVRMSSVSGEISSLEPSRVRPGQAWVGTRGSGLWSLNLKDGIVSRVDGRVADGTPIGVTEALTVREDAQGLLWMGSARGLFKADLRQRRFPQPLVLPGGAPVLSLYEAPSTPSVLWAGTLRAGLFRVGPSGVRRFFSDPEKPGNLVFTMLEDASGRFWFGSNMNVLFELNRSTMAVTEHPLDPIRAGQVIQIFEDPARPGFLWITTQSRGLLEFDTSSNRVARHFNTASPGHVLPSDYVWVVRPVRDRPGSLWVGTHDAGLLRLDVDSGVVTPVEMECNIDAVLSLEEWSDILWLGTLSSGLVAYFTGKGTCERFTMEDGISGSDVGALLTDDDGRLWLLTTNGLTRFDPTSRSFTQFFRQDGLQHDIFHYPAHLRRADGTFRLGGPRGITTFDPSLVPVDTLPPLTTITELLVDGRPHPLRRTAQGIEPITLRHDQSDLEFRFAALDLRAPDRNQYRVRLDGAEDTWRPVHAVSQRYPYLSPNRYTFRVQGAGRDGYWTRRGAAIDVRIRPPFWNTWYFRAGTALLILGMVVGAYQYRIAHLRRLERTRNRIANDLHDDIGSRISSVALRLDLAGRRDGLDPDLASQLEVLSDSARGVVDELRDSVWVVDADHDDLRSLADRMEQFAGVLLQGRSWSFERDEPLPDVSLDMEKRRHLYFLFKEALHNAVRHAEATRIDIRLSIRHGRLHLLIRDDGRGFDPDAAHSGRGLTTMRERAQAVGGTLTLTSAPGRGTCLEASAPLRG